MQLSDFKKFFICSLNSVFPRCCPVCESKISEYNTTICPNCRIKIKKIEEPMCKKCGLPVIPENRNILCGKCIISDYSFDKARSLYIYDNPLKEMIIKMKYYNNIFFLPPLIELLLENLQINSSEYDMIIPVPLHNSRLKKRGFNQSAIFAKSISKKLKIKCEFGIIKRIKNTPPQTSLKLRERIKNIKNGTFDLVKRDGKLEGKKILLIDDVITTGSTVSECCRILKQKGNAKSVDVLSLARTILN